MSRFVHRLRAPLGFVLSLQLALPGPTIAASGYKPANDDATIVHVLNRMTFGPRPADIARLKEIGVLAWIEGQLKPASGDDKALGERLGTLTTIGLSTAELRQKYEIPPNVRQQMQRARAERDAERQMAGQPPMGEPGDMTPANRRAYREEMVKQFPQLANMQGTPQQVLTELQAAKVIRAAYAERQLDELMADFWFNHFNVFARKGPVEFMLGEHESVIRQHAMGKFEDLLVATAKSPAMLFYLDNWQSVDPKYDPREEIMRQRQQERGRGGMGRGGRNGGRRPGQGVVNGRRQPGGVQGGMQEGMQGQNAQNRPPRRSFGINENYARELMELHTLGVDGGYTQADVIEVAKAFTGWTIAGEGPRSGPRNDPEAGYAFEEARHVNGDKKVLGHTIKNGGEKEGTEILHLLATHPSTAKFIATKLVRRFVSDEPPKELVLRAAATFGKTRGDIREVMRTILTSEDFLSTKYRSAKVKTPFEFVVASVRASGADVRNARSLTQRIADMGMPLYLQQPPTGYKDTADEWISTAALLGRMNFALDLSAGKIRGVQVNTAALSEGSLDTVAARFLPGGGLSDSSKRTLEAEAKKEGGEPSRLVGLVLGSPEFQRR
jgi:uncharacterized protein (DUF1800 family)